MKNDNYLQLSPNVFMTNYKILYIAKEIKKLHQPDF